eukprot:2712605-Rhodomonas_salina.1
MSIQTRTVNERPSSPIIGYKPVVPSLSEAYNLEADRQMHMLHLMQGVDENRRAAEYMAAVEQANNANMQQMAAQGAMYGMYGTPQAVTSAPFPPPFPAAQGFTSPHAQSQYVMQSATNMPVWQGRGFGGM